MYFTTHAPQSFDGQLLGLFFGLPTPLRHFWLRIPPPSTHLRWDFLAPDLSVDTITLAVLMEEQPSEPAGTLWPPASTTLGCVLVERSFPTRKRVRAASPALPSPDDHALPCSTLDTAIGGWKSMKDEHVYIATMLANTEAQPDTRAEFVALVRVLRGLDSLRCRSPDDTVIPQKDLQAALKKEGVHVGCYQLIHMLRLAQRECWCTD